MHTQQLSGTELLITFDNLDERARFLLGRKFTYNPGEGCAARWTSKPGGGDPVHHLELIPANDSHCDNLQALAMRITRFRL